MSTSGDQPGDDRQATPLQQLAGARYLRVTTFRRDGRAVSTPVWFLIRDGHLWARSAADSGKVKRIRNNPQVRIAPCTRDGTQSGPSIPAVATLVPRRECAATYRALLRRYGLTAQLYDLYWTRVTGVRAVLLRFTLVPSPDTPPPQPNH